MVYSNISSYGHIYLTELQVHQPYDILFYFQTEIEIWSFWKGYYDSNKKITKIKTEISTL